MRKRCQTGLAWKVCARSSAGSVSHSSRRRARRVHVAGELDIAAERQPADLPARAAPVGPAGDLAAEADREDVGLHPEQAAGEIMAELVDEDQRPDHEQEAERSSRASRDGRWSTANPSCHLAGARAAPRASIVEHLVDRAGAGGSHSDRSVSADDGGDIEESRSAGEEGGDRDLVGGVEDRPAPRRPARSACAGEAERREAHRGRAPRSRACRSRPGRAARTASPSAPARRACGRSAPACRARRAGRAPSRRHIRRGCGPPIAGGRRPRAGRRRPGRGGRPRSARAPCSSGSRESTEILAPIDQLGWATACGRRRRAHLARSARCGTGRRSR